MIKAKPTLGMLAGFFAKQENALAITVTAKVFFPVTPRILNKKKPKLLV
jgi:hypothetical protein